MRDVLRRTSLSLSVTRRLNSQQHGAFWGLLANDTGHFLNTALCDFSSRVWCGSLQCLSVLGSPRTQTQLSVTQQVLMNSLSSGASKAPGCSDRHVLHSSTFYGGRKRKNKFLPLKWEVCLCQGFQMDRRAASYHPHSSKHIRDMRKSDFAERRLMRERQTEVTDDLVLRLENS